MSSSDIGPSDGAFVAGFASEWGDEATTGGDTGGTEEEGAGDPTPTSLFIDNKTVLTICL